MWGWPFLPRLALQRTCISEGMGTGTSGTAMSQKTKFATGNAWALMIHTPPSLTFWIRP